MLEKSRKTKTMTHFLDIHTTDRTALRSIIDSAHAMKAARKRRPKGSPMTNSRLPAAWSR